MKPIITRAQAVELLSHNKVYNALDLDDFSYEDEKGNVKYLSIYDILATLGVTREEIDL